MLADRTLLTVTLATTFVAGGAAGWSARDRKADAPFLPTKAEHVYAARLAALRQRGYTDSELRLAVAIHQQYLDEYRDWWRKFLDQNDKALEGVDNRFHAKLDALELSFRERTGTPPPAVEKPAPRENRR